MRFGLSLCFILACFITAPTWAAETDPLPKGMALQGNFEHKRILDGFDNALISKGIFVLVPNKILLWQTREPVASRLIIAGSMVRQMIDGNEVFARSITDAGRLSVLSELLQAALSGNWQVMQGKFKVEKKTPGTGWHHIYRARGNDQDLPMRQIEFLGRGYVDEVRIEHKNGDRDEIRFSDQLTLPMSDALTRHALK